MSLLKSALTGKDAFHISSWSCPSFILSPSSFSFDKFELLILGILKNFRAFVFAEVILFSFLFKSFFWWIRYFFQMFLSFCSFHLVYQLKAHMKLNGRKWLDEMEWRNSEKNQKFLVLNDKWCFCLLTFNSWADIITRYNFNQVSVFLHLIDFMV